MSPPSVGNPGSPDATNNGGSMQKPKSMRCRYCERRFRRLEHVQRHERTHTKEKPFQCTCGKTFGRRDLLVRHERLVHLKESNKDGEHSMSNVQESIEVATPLNRANAPASTPNHIDPDILGGQTINFTSRMSQISGHQPDIRIGQHKTPGYSLDLLSDAASHVVSGNYVDLLPVPRIVPDTQDEMDVDTQDNLGYTEQLQDDNAIRHSGYLPVSGQPGLLEAYDLFLDDFGLSSHFFPTYDTGLPVGLITRPMVNEVHAGQNDQMRSSTQDAQEQHNSFSRFGSRLPSLQPEERERTFGLPRSSEDVTKNGPPWRVTTQDHRILKTKLDEFSSVLPADFSLPLRHTMSRFLEGYINGFHEHMPFLHIPTLAAVNCAPELLLALAAVGAQYRFEGYRGNRLWYAARAVAMEQIRRRSSQEVHDILSPPVSIRRCDSAVPSPHSIVSDAVIKHNSTIDDTPRDRLQTIQSIFLLVAMGTWGGRTLLRDALGLRGHLSVLMREEGFTQDNTSTEELSWEHWIQLEGAKRIKFIVFCFFNLHCIAYDMPPHIVSSEVRMALPQTAREWKAENEEKWREIRRETPPVEIYFHDALARLFTKTTPNIDFPPTSSLGNYILINAIIQQIYFVRQTSIWTTPSTMNNSLRSEDIDELGQALRAWQGSWERTPESSLDPSNPNGPIAFNSTALLRLAYIRLHIDLGPCRRLDSRDPALIAEAIKDFPPLIRNSRISRAVLQSAHALSIPVKIGIAFVARTQTFSWSIQHSLCNLECAFLLSKWLETISMVASNELTSDERTLLDMVRNMLDETEFAVSFEPHDGEREVDERARIKELGVAVVRLWAETFKGTHIFDIVKVIGLSLDIYADLLERAYQPATS